MCLLFILLSWKANNPLNQSNTLYPCINVCVNHVLSLVGSRIIATHQQITYRQIKEISANKPRTGLLLQRLCDNSTVNNSTVDNSTEDNSTVP